MKRITLILASVLFAASACAKKRTLSSQDGTVLTAYRLIDARRNDEAIALLEGELKKDPSNYEYRVVLASAYANSAGVNVRTLVPAIQEIKELGKLKKSAVKNRSATDFALSLASLLVRFSAMIDVYTAVPVVTTRQEVSLRHSISLLRDLNTEILPEDAFYRAVLEIVLFKKVMNDQLLGEFVAPEKADPSSCRVDLTRTNDSVIQLGRLAIDVFQDLALAKPKKAKEYKKLADSTTELVTNVSMSLAGASLVDDVAAVFLSETAIQNGLGKIVKCGGRSD